jgi:microcystin-dependent protein
MDPFIGQLICVGFNFAPPGWAQCNGQLLSIAQNSALFALLGTTYGGDGRTTFGLPDLRGRAPIGVGQGPGLSNYTQGQMGGTENVTLTAAQIPSHTHATTVAVGVTINAGSGGNLSGTATGNLLASQARGGVTPPTVYTDATTPTPLGAGAAAATATATVAAVGGSQPHSIVQPYTAMMYIIATQGIFPSRP